MLKKLVNLIEYLPTIAENVHIVGDEQNGTSALNSAGRGRQQVVAVLPLADFEGDVDRMVGPLTIIVFVLEKALAASGTPDQARAQYIGCVRRLDDILDKIARDITRGGGDGPCPLLAGLDLQDVKVIPEASVFGGWNGYSATITLR